jgi:hypothetical protein
MACTACLVCFINTVHGRSKKRSLGSLALVAGTLQTLSNLFCTFNIYGLFLSIVFVIINKVKMVHDGILQLLSIISEIANREQVTEME